MTVTGAVTAALRPTGYVPPFQRGQAQVPVILTTGVPNPSATYPSPSSTSSGPAVNPWAPGAAAYATSYLQSHMMSVPSYRYAILLWCALAAISIAYAVAHHLRLSGGSLGAAYSKWGMRRMTVLRRALPSNSVLVTMALVTALAVLACLIGNDYIDPKAGLFEFGGKALVHRATNSPTAPTWTISKTLWTIASRFGITAFALTPLVVLLALKAPPFAVFSLPFFTHLYADRLATLHRAAAWLMFGITTVHVVLWTVQLFKDTYNGKAMWFTIFASQRFIFGCIAYFFMCLMMVLSIRPVRKRQYEFFYLAHVVTVTLTLVAMILHHPVLWYWVTPALGLWAADRLWRAARYLRLNGSNNRTPARMAETDYKKVADDIALQEFHDKMSPANGNTYDADPRFQAGHTDGGYAEYEIRPLGTYAETWQAGNQPPFGGQQQPPSGGQQRVVSGASTYSAASGLSAIPPPQLIRTDGPTPTIPAGFAQAQLLPSRTVRLTIQLPRPLNYAPGQSVLLTLPELSAFQSHPFTICNNDRSELVLLVKARKGLTRKLYNLVRQRSEMNSSAPSEGNMTVPSATPVFVRTRIDGPMGSAGRIRWNWYSTALIICGGSGVSFGMAVCEHICRLAASHSQKGIKRIRFVWVVREYAEIGWAASALCRAKQMVAPGQLQIDIFVTNAATTLSTKYDDYAPPRPTFGEHGRTPSMDSMTSQMSRMSDHDAENQQYDSFELEMQNAGAQAIDLSLYEDDEDIDDPAQKALSYQVQKQGKVRRARTRRAARRSRPGHDTTYPTPGGNSAAPPGHIDDTLSFENPDARNPSAWKYPAYPPAPVGGPGASADGSESPRPNNPSESGSLAPPAHHQRRTSSDSLQPIQRSGVFGSHSPQPSMTSFNSFDPHAYGEDLRLTGAEADYRRSSYLSTASAIYDQYNSSTTHLEPAPTSGWSSGSQTPTAAPPPLPPKMDDAERARHATAVRSRTQNMVLLQDSSGAGAGAGGAPALWIDEADYAAMSILSEMAVSGRPKLGAIFAEEVERSAGAMLVATCGPAKLNTVVRNLVSRNIRPGKILRGDRSGNIEIFSEDFEA